MLLLARELRGLTLNEAAELLCISPSYVNKLERDAQAVNEELMQKMEKKFNLPASFFYQPGEILPSLLNYRKRENVSAKDLNVIEATINMYRLGIEKLFDQFNVQATRLPAFLKEPEEAAQELKRSWRIAKGPVENMTALLEKHGITVVTFDYPTERVDGKSVLTKDGHSIVFINSLSQGDRQRFTLAYQLGHLVMHTTGNSFDRDVSHEANVFAAEFLMPEKEIRKDFEEGITVPVLAKLKKKWKVSMISLLYRAHDLQIITDNQKRYIEQQFNQLKIRRREPVELDIPREKPVLLRALITEFKQKKRMTIKEMASFFNLTEEEFTQRYN
ncbi:MAG: XRE family transcriptional regulator [Bacteroidota bacterium]